MTTPWLVFCGALIFLVIYVAYRIGKLLLRVFIGLAALALLSWGLWKFFHS
ncbi:MAG: hypothetical protein HXX12_02785 [Geothrix sp.]|uniref:hypothetical protein n=1 Tax=Geothrix sp. TaxID=1962974 RepID=UPI00185E45B3|nr:hypothetical protein [Geothrix sp.]NWJ39883.1 hypothetical protein [Geothrix sp.]WIL22104.1 MAG: hypothetical protein QOZ81_001393 [Geothrix sp.]